MSEKFLYASGKPGFGTKGIDGSDGSQGLSMYFTDYDPTISKTLIDTKIANNQLLFTNYSGNLPDSRVYITGDLFVDSDGAIYEINAETNTFVSLGINLNTAGYFISANVSSSDGFQRYYNSNISPKYLIDTLYTDSAISYFSTPTDIYTIQPINFARIEYSNVVQNSYNPFTLYSAAKTTDAQPDSKSIAIVREIDTNTFRIGNLDNTGNLRNVNLIFDVSTLKQTKQTNLFNISTPEGTILTNYEINANSLFDPAFNRNPSSFIATYKQTEVSIFWSLPGFSADPEIVADLYFFNDLSTNGNTYSVISDSSGLVPRVFHEVSTSGSVQITNLTEGKPYKYYMNLSKNGWERRSEIKKVNTSLVPSISITPVSYINDVPIGHKNGFTVNTNVAFTANIIVNPSSFLYDLSVNTTLIAADGSMYVDVSNNFTHDIHIGKIRIASAADPTYYKDVSISQLGLPPFVTLSFTENDAICSSPTIFTRIASKTIDPSIAGLPEGNVERFVWSMRTYGTGNKTYNNIEYWNRIRVVRNGYTIVDNAVNNIVNPGDGTTPVSFNNSLLSSSFANLDVCTNDSIYIMLDVETVESGPKTAQQEFVMNVDISMSLVHVSGAPIVLVGNPQVDYGRITGKSTTACLLWETIPEI